MKHRIDRHQLTFDDLLALPKTPELSAGSLEFSLELRRALAEALKQTRKSRFEVAGSMSHLLGLDVSKHQIDAWCAESRDGWRFPLEYAVAFEVATESFLLTELLAVKRGYRIVMGDEIRQVEIGRLEAMRTEINERLRRLKQMRIK